MSSGIYHFQNVCKWNSLNFIKIPNDIKKKKEKRKSQKETRN